eukprot:maker-scaffold507_size152468-snap-gene-0.33 protein:Tk11918 transcript:maker-scaffold507_size152468-snap-gene-0.33-mRNA-1 annotation:"vitellogenin receptor"
MGVSHLLILASFAWAHATENVTAPVETDYVSCMADIETFLCPDEILCVPIERKCDGREDCRDGADEFGCSKPFQCKGQHMFKCDSGDECISTFWKCDDDYDCADRSDEKDCNPFLPEKNHECHTDESMCRNGICLPSLWFCDGQPDCPDKSDESEESCGIQARGAKPCDGFKCPTDPLKCLPDRWVCDGHAECPDGADEADEKCREEETDAVTHECRPGMFKCGHLCLNSSLVCDGILHCPNGTDEGDFCQMKACDNVKCATDQHCVPKENGPLCVCLPGYEMSKEGDSCEDIDECREYGACSQICINTLGSYECSCKPGYRFNRQTNVCVAENHSPKLFFSTRTEIRGIEFGVHMKTSFRVALDKGHLREAIGVGFDGLTSRVYWTSILDKQEGISSAQLDGFNYRPFKSNQVIKPEDLAVDHLGRNVYFTESKLKHISACSMNTLECARLVDLDPSEKPRAIAVYPERGLMFYSDWGSAPGIVRAGMDGSQKHYVISEDIFWPNGVIVDKVTERIFWAEAKFKRLESANLDGQDRRVVLEQVNHPFSVAVFQETLYWSDWHAKEILSCNKFTGKNRTTLVKAPNLEPMGIAIYHPLLELHMESNPCADSFCSHVCVLTPRGGSVCKCPSDHILGVDSEALIIGFLVFIIVAIIIALSVYCCIKHQRAQKSSFSMHFRNPAFGRHHLPSTSEELKNVEVVKDGSYSSFSTQGDFDPSTHHPSSAVSHQDLFAAWDARLNGEPDSSKLPRASTNPNLASISSKSSQQSSPVFGGTKSSTSYLGDEDDTDMDSVSLGAGVGYPDTARLIP